MSYEPCLTVSSDGVSVLASATGTVLSGSFQVFSTTFNSEHTQYVTEEPKGS